MSVSGTTVFDLDVKEMIEESYERCGIEVRDGYSMRTARRSLNLIFMEWANRGINLWTVTERELPLINGTKTYTLGTDVVDLLEHTVEVPGTNAVGNTQYTVTRVSVSTYATRSNKDVPGRPTEIYIQRLRPAPQITLWPVPNDDTMVLHYWLMARIDDAGDYTNTLDVPFRFVPALTAGLAYHLARKALSAPDQEGPAGSSRYAIQFLEARIARLQQDYEAAWAEAAIEDREKASLMLVPRGNLGWNY